MHFGRILAAFVLTAFGTAALSQARDLPDFTRLVEEQGSAVVNIAATKSVRRTQAVPGVEDEEAQEFFRRFIPRPPQQGPGQRPESRSVGSGFIISADGYLLTNAHVVDEAEEILVKFTDKREFKARIIGADKLTDVALLKIDGSGVALLRRSGDRSVPFLIEMQFDESQTLSARGLGKVVRTLVQVTIRPQRGRDRRRRDVLERAQHLLASLKSYLVAQDHDPSVKAAGPQSQTAIESHRLKAAAANWSGKSF